MSPESLNSTLAALRKAGAVFGVLFTKGDEELFSDLAYSSERIADLSQLLSDIISYFDQEGRNPEFLSFGYDGGNVILILREGYRLAVLHHHADEADFILTAGGDFLTDYISGRAAMALEAGQKPPSPSAPRKAKPPRQVAPTTPITPVMRQR